MKMKESHWPPPVVHLAMYSEIDLALPLLAYGQTGNRTETGKAIDCKSDGAYGYWAKVYNVSDCCGHLSTKSATLNLSIPVVLPNLNFDYVAKEVNCSHHACRNAAADATCYQLHGSVGYTRPNLTYALVRNAAPGSSASVGLRARDDSGRLEWVDVNVVGL